MAPDTDIDRSRNESQARNDFPVLQLNPYSEGRLRDGVVGSI